MGETSVWEVQSWESLAHKENEIMGVDMKSMWYEENQGKSPGKHQNL